MCSVAAETFSSEADPLDQLAGALDRLAREEPLDLPSTALGGQIERMATLRNRMDAEFNRRVAVFDRTLGFAAFDAHSIAAWLKHTVRLSPNAEGGCRLIQKLDRTWVAIRDARPP